MLILKRQVYSSRNFVSLFSFMKDNSSVLFSSNNIYFVQKETIKVKIFETFECLGQNVSNSLWQFWNDKSIPLQILHPSSVSWKIIPLYFFNLNNLYSAQKERIKVKRLSSTQVKICQIPYANFEVDDSSPDFVSLFSFMKDNSSVLF